VGEKGKKLTNLRVRGNLWKAGTFKLKGNTEGRRGTGVKKGGKSSDTIKQL